MSQAWVALALSLKVALCATLVNLVLGVLVARWMARRVFPGRPVLDALLTMPMVLPPTVLGYYLLIVLGSHGPIGHMLDAVFGVRLIFTWPAAVIAATLVSFPLVYKSARAAFEMLDADIEAAARTLGSSEVAVFFRVSVPMAWRGILAGLLLGFARAMGEFGATLMVAGSIPGKTQTLAIAIYESAQAGDDPATHLLVLFTTTACLSVLLMAGWLAGGRARPGD